MTIRKTTKPLAMLVLTIALMLSMAGLAVAKPLAKITVDTVEAQPGSSVTVDVNISDNPGILGATLKLTYDDALTLTGGTSGEAFSALSMSKPGKLVSGCVFGWDGEDLAPADIKDGTILSLTFDVATDAKPGDTLAISAVCDSPVDADLNAVDVTVANGAVKVSGQAASDAEPDLLSASKEVAEYDVGDALKLDDLSVWVVNTDKSITALKASDYTVDSSKVDMDAPGTYNLLVSYTAGDEVLTAEVPITVNAVLESIKVKLGKTEYNAGEALDVNDITVMATYSGNMTRKVEGFESNAANIDMNVAGEKTLSVSYKDGHKTAKDSVVVIVKPVLKSIALTKGKTSYEIGDTFSLDDLVVKAVYAGQADTVLAAGDYAVESGSVDMSVAGVYPVTVSYSEGSVSVEASIDIVVGSILRSIDVSKERTEYFVGDEFSTDDLAVSAVYSGGVTRVLSEDEYTIDASRIDMVSVGQQRLIISYNEGESSVEAVVVIVVKPALVSISLSKDALVYAVGSKISLDDLVVKASYSDGSEAELKEYQTNLAELDTSTTGAKELVVTVTQGENAITSSLPIVVVESSVIDEKVDIASVPAHLESTEEYYSFGLFVEPKVVVSGLTQDKDYMVVYSNNVNAGTGEAHIYGIGDFKGTKTLTFTIKPMSIVYADLELAKKSMAYTGKALTPKVSSYWADSGDYTLANKNNKNIGKATVTITGKKNYTGKMTLSFDIVPGKAAFKSVKPGKKKIVAAVKAQKGGVKYQVSYRLGKGKWKTVTLANAKKKATIKKLKAGKKYSVKVRAFKKVGGKTYYGAWSSAKTVKVRK